MQNALHSYPGTIGPKSYVFIMAQPASSNIEKVWIGSKTYGLWSRGRVESAEPEKNPKYIKPSAFPRSVWEWELAKKSTFCKIQRGIGGKNFEIAIDDPGPERKNNIVPCDIFKNFFSFLSR